MFPLGSHPPSLMLPIFTAAQIWMRTVLSHLSAGFSLCAFFFCASRFCLGWGCPASRPQPFQKQHCISQCILTDVRVVAGHRPSLSAEKQNLSEGSLRGKKNKKKKENNQQKNPKPLPVFGKEKKKQKTNPNPKPQTFHLICVCARMDHL